jgi:hypothetical protein
MGGAISDDPASHYIAWLSSTLGQVLAANTTPNEKGSYITSFNAQEFLDSFEALAEAHNNSLPEGKKQADRKPRAGASTNDLKAAFEKKMSRYNKTLPTMWMEKLKKGSIAMSDMQQITSDAGARLNGWQGSRSQPKADLTNVVAAYEAMKQLRASRNTFAGFFWKLFNRERNRQEANYLETLDAEIKKLKNANYDVEGISNELTGKTVFGKEVPNAIKAKSTAAPEPKTLEQLQPEKNVLIMGDGFRVPLFDDDHPYTENVNTTSSPQVSNEHKPNAPTLNNNGR